MKVIHSLAIEFLFFFLYLSHKSIVDCDCFTFRQVHEQNPTSIINEHSSDFFDTRASTDQNVLASLFNINLHQNQTSNETASSTSHSIPMTTIPSIQTKSRTEVWISRLPNAQPVTEADYESQV